MSIIEGLAGLGPAQLVGVLGSVLDRLGEVGLVSLTDRDLLAHVGELTAAAARLDAARLAAVGEVDTRGVAVTVAGASSTVNWLRGVLRQRPAAAKTQVCLAQALARSYPATAAALAQGRISADHAQVITRTLDRLAATITAAELAQAERTLLGHAADYDPLILARLGRHLAYVLDPDADADLEALEARLHARRELFLSPHDDGSWQLRAHLDPYVGTQLWTVLDALSAPRPATGDGLDPRTAAQRRADALAEVCERHLAAGQLPTAGGQRPTVVITTTLATLQGHPGAPPATLPNGTPISVAQLRRIACDAAVIPIVMGADSTPLDYGRRTYTVPPALRRATLIRDHWQCVIPGCPNTPRHTHHITPWEHHGETTLDNLASLCGHHHRWIHHNRLHHITPNPGGPPHIHTHDP